MQSQPLLFLFLPHFLSSTPTLSHTHLHIYNIPEENLWTTSLSQGFQTIHCEPSTFASYLYFQVQKKKKKNVFLVYNGNLWWDWLTFQESLICVLGFFMYHSLHWRPLHLGSAVWAWFLLISLATSNAPFSKLSMHFHVFMLCTCCFLSRILLPHYSP